MASMVGTRAAMSEIPNRRREAATNHQYIGGFCRNGSPASVGTSQSRLSSISRAIPATRGSSGVQREWLNEPGPGRRHRHEDDESSAMP